MEENTSGSADTESLTSQLRSGIQNITIEGSSRSSIQDRQDLMEVDASERITIFKTLVDEKTFEVDKIVNDWVHLFKIDKEKAFLELMELIINTSGLVGIVPVDIMKMEECADILDMPKDPLTREGLYPFKRKTLYWRLFRTNYVNFIQKIGMAEYSIIHYDYLMTNFFSRIIILMKCPWEPLRHVATLTALKMTTSLVDKASGIIKHFDSMLELHGVFELEPKITQELLIIKEKLQIVLDVVLDLSHRDFNDQVRLLTISEIYTWICKCPKYFLSHEYLRFFETSFCDEFPEVRLSGIKFLQLLYEQQEYQSELINFTEIIKIPINKMLYEGKSNLLFEVVKLIDIIESNTLDFDVDKKLYCLVYHQSSNVGKAAGKILIRKIVSKLDLKESRNKLFIANIIKFSLRMKHQRSNQLLVDALIESTLFLQDWESYSELLLEGFDFVDEFSDNNKEMALIDLLVWCVERISTGISFRETNAKAIKDELNLSFKKSDERRYMTLYFLKNLSPLLKKYFPNKEKVSQLMKIPQYFDIDEQMLEIEKNNIQTLNADLWDIIRAYTKPEIYTSFLLTYRNFAAINESQKNKYKIEIESLMYIQMCSFGAVIDEYDKNKTVSAEDYKILFIALQNMSLIIKHWNVDCSDRIDKFIIFSSEESIFPESVFIMAIECTFYSLYGKIKDTRRLDPSDQDEPFSELKKLFERYNKLYELVIAKSPLMQLKKKTFDKFCVLLSSQSEIYSRDENNPNASKLMCKLPDETLKIMNEFALSIMIDKLDQLSKREFQENRLILRNYCGLIEDGVLPWNQAINIIQNYPIRKVEYGDVIEGLISHIMADNKINSFKMIFDCLKQSFKPNNEIRQINEENKELFTILAKSLALLFPFNENTREGFCEMHKDAILFAFDGWDCPEDNEHLPVWVIWPDPPNLYFLDAMIEFMTYLDPRDGEQILNLLNQQVHNEHRQVRGYNWDPLHRYRTQLETLIAECSD